MMFTLRQLVEKELEGHDDTATGFTHLEKAYDTILRKIAMGRAELETAGNTRGG